MGDGTKSLAEDKGHNRHFLPLIYSARMIIQISEQCNCKGTFASLFCRLHMLLADMIAIL